MKLPPLADPFPGLPLNHTTSFFREGTGFPALRSYILPRLLQAGIRDLRVVSAGCSTGQEAYSVAMLVLAYFPSFTLRVTGLDIDPESVGRARAGVYTAAEIDGLGGVGQSGWAAVGPGSQLRGGLPPTFLPRFFAPSCVSDQWHADDALQDAATFHVADLRRPWPLGQSKAHVIILRNVLGHLVAADRGLVVEYGRAALAPGGYVLTEDRPEFGLDRKIIGNTAVFQDLRPSR